MPTTINLPTKLSNKEVEEFNKMCHDKGILPAVKIGELIHGFLVAEGVKHQVKSA
jgi:hypothetical protein